jgi:citrate lyase beta subunit
MQEPRQRPRRSLLFVPADQPRRIAKAATLPSDSIIIDLEDAVDPSRKSQARDDASAALGQLEFGRRETILRINDRHSPEFARDLNALAEFTNFPVVIALPKVESADDIATLAQFLDVNGLPCLVLPMIESARGVLAAADIAAASPRITALMFGGHDFSANIGTAYCWEATLLARSQIVLAAAANGIDAIDTPWIDLEDVGGLATECARGRQLGFAGKAAIHPKQLEIINAAFSPTAEEIKRAGDLLAWAESHGVGASRFDGKMVDQATIQVARRILSRTRPPETNV